MEGGRDYGKAEISDYTLRNYYLKTFKAAIEADVATVMNSFSEISGQPVASCEKDAITLENLKNGEKFRLSIMVANTGRYGGKEVTQCYIHDLVASMTRPVRELKGFSKIFLKQGESREVVFELGFGELGFYNADGKFCVEPGEFDVFISGDCMADNKVKITVL